MYNKHTQLYAWLLSLCVTWRRTQKPPHIFTLSVSLSLALPRPPAPSFSFSVALSLFLFLSLTSAPSLSLAHTRYTAQLAAVACPLGGAGGLTYLQVGPMSECIRACLSAQGFRPSSGRFTVQSGIEERWGAGVETQKNVRGEIGGWGRVPFNETYAPSLSTIYDGA